MVLAEARAAAALNHPNVCTIPALDDSEGVPVIVMEYVDGQSLEVLSEAGALTAEQMDDLGCQIARGMALATKKKTPASECCPLARRRSFIGKMQAA